MKRANSSCNGDTTVGTAEKCRCNATVSPNRVGKRKRFCVFCSGKGRSDGETVKRSHPSLTPATNVTLRQSPPSCTS
eukprot:scaffold4731_cov175-Ochromonas_danica.AAC.14